MKKKALSYPSLVVILTGLCLSLLANGEDFKCRFKISDGEKGIRKVVLSEDVYGCLQYNDYKDLTIVNSDGRVVPIKRLTGRAKQQSYRYKQPIDFYLEPASTAFSTEQYFRKLMSLPNNTDKPDSETGYFYSLILNRASQKNDNAGSLQALTFNLETSDSVSAIAMVEASHDLQTWRQASKLTQLYYLGNQTVSGSANQSLQQLNITLNKLQNANYYRVVLYSHTPNLLNKLSRIIGNYHYTEHFQQELQWVVPKDLSLSFSNDDTESTYVIATLPGALPISQLKLTSNLGPRVISGVVYAENHKNPEEKTSTDSARRQSKEKLKRVVKKAVGRDASKNEADTRDWVYQGRFEWVVVDDADEHEKYINVHNVRSQHWKIKRQQAEALNGSEWPTLHFGWQASEFIFIAEGSGPFYLLAGRNTPADQRTIDQHLSIDQNQLKTLDLFIEKGHPVNSENDLEKTQSVNASGYAKWIVLSLLLLGLTIMALMAHRLFKQIHS